MKKRLDALLYRLRTPDLTVDEFCRVMKEAIRCEDEIASYARKLHGLFVEAEPIYKYFNGEGK